MAKLRFSSAAKNDLQNIARDTIRQFGVNQSNAYRDGFKRCFGWIVENPKTGREVDNIRPGLRRFDHKSYAIYYIQMGEYLVIVRILRNWQNPGNYLGEMG